jgi:hypothetical protein
MASYGPELIQIMRAVLDEVMTKIPVEQVTPGVKAHMAEVILKGRRRRPDQLRRTVGLGVGSDPDDSFDADLIPAAGIPVFRRVMPSTGAI